MTWFVALGDVDFNQIHDKRAPSLLSGKVKQQLSELEPLIQLRQIYMTFKT